MLNRNNAPDLTIPDSLLIPEAVTSQLKNGTPYITINSGTQEVIKIDLIFEAGSV